MRKLIAIAIAIAVAGTLCGLVLLLRAANNPIETRNTTLHVAAQARPTPITAAAPAVPVDGVKTLAALDAHVDAFAARARAQRQLSRDEVAKVHASIDELAPDRKTALQMHREFGERVRLLAHDLELAPTHDELARLLADLRGEANRAKRDRLIAAYRVSAQTLPPAHRTAAVAMLTSTLDRRR